MFFNLKKRYKNNFNTYYYDKYDTYEDYDNYTRYRYNNTNYNPMSKIKTKIYNQYLKLKKFVNSQILKK